MKLRKVEQERYIAICRNKSVVEWTVWNTALLCILRWTQGGASMTLCGHIHIYVHVWASIVPAIFLQKFEMICRTVYVWCVLAHVEDIISSTNCTACARNNLSVVLKA